MSVAFASSLHVVRITSSHTLQRRRFPVCVVRGSKQSSIQRPRIGPKVPPLGVPSEDFKVNFPLSRELDYLLNTPVAELVVTGLVVLTAFGFAFETVDLGSPFLNKIPVVIENVVTFLFTAEYFLRWYGRNLNPKFLLSRSMLVDLFAIAPLFLNAALTSINPGFIRLLRLSRVFRLQRLMNEEWSDLMGDMTPTQIRLANVALSVFSIIYISAGFFYDAEVGLNPQVVTFFDAFYFSTITLFTVGFGDITPLTGMGRIVTACTVLSGAVLIPIQLTEVERARAVAKRAKESSTSNTKRLPDLLENIVPFDFDIECSRCHLRGHQKDARFCRSCANLLTNRRFENVRD